MKHFCSNHKETMTGRSAHLIVANKLAFFVPGVVGQYRREAPSTTGLRPPLRMTEHITLGRSCHAELVEASSVEQNRLVTLSLSKGLLRNKNEKKVLRFAQDDKKE